MDRNKKNDFNENIDKILILEMIGMDLKVKDLKSGRVHRLKDLRRTCCGIGIRRDESRWSIVGSSEEVNCTSNRCKRLRMGRMLWKMGQSMKSQEKSMKS